MHVSVGGKHSCLVDDLVQIFCTGDNLYGQLAQPGDGRDTFGPIDGAVPLKDVHAGYERSCGLTAEGAVYCFGRNDDPVLIDGWPGVLTEPIQLGSEVGWDTISMGFWHVCLLRQGELYCLGRNDHGETGSQPAGDVTEPTRVGDVTYSLISAGRDFTCAIRAEDSHLVCFGRNDTGQLGRTGAASPEPTPVCIPP
jgi:hypothetical protein